MKRPSTEHPEELFLEYLEGALSTEEHMVVEEHLNECGDCRAMLDELRQISAALGAHRESVFCPEPWELHEQAASGSRPSERIGQHLEQCAECSREWEEYGTPSQPDRMPLQVTDAFKALASRQQSDHEPQARKSFAAKAVSHLARLFSVPMLSLVPVAAAAVLAVVLLYPFGPLDPMLGLSTVQWTEMGNGPKATPKSLVAVEKQQVAVVLLFDEFYEAPSQELVDSLYQALQPPAELGRKFEFVQPSRLKTSIADVKIDPANPSALLQRLAQDFSVPVAVIVTVTAQETGYRISGELLDTKTGDSLERVVVPQVNDSALAAATKDSAFDLLSASSKSK